MVLRRMPVITAALLVMLTAVPAAAVAGEGCPAEASGFRSGAVNWEWQPGDPIPAGDVIWEETIVAGALAEGATLEDIAAVFGVVTAEELYGLALEFWRSVDRNLDGVVCFKPPPPNQNGIPLYLALFVDSNAQTSR